MNFRGIFKRICGFIPERAGWLQSSRAGSLAIENALWNCFLPTCCVNETLAKVAAMIRRRSFLLGSTLSSVMAKSAFSPSLEAALSSGGDMLITGFKGVSSADPEVAQVQRYIEQGKIAGVILLGRNIRSPEQLERLTASLQSAAGDMPLIVAIDQEGGAIARVGPKTGFMHWQSAADLALMGLRNQDIYDYYFVRAAELRAAGINLNLAPVVDLNVNPASAIIGALGRSYSANVETVVRYAELFIRAHRDAGLLTCVKHFPGHGSAYSDSHLGAADVSQTWQPKEIAPFDRLAQAGLLDSVMTAHVLLSYMSDDPWVPVSLSEKSVFEIRDGLRFTGPVITDDLQMGAITTLMSPEEASIPAAKAGNTLLIYSNGTVALISGFGEVRCFEVDHAA